MRPVSGSHGPPCAEDPFHPRCARCDAGAGGASVAANFLSRFVEGVPWAHLDIAGVAWRANSNKGATGRPVPLLVDFLLGAAQQ